MQFWSIKNLCDKQFKISTYVKGALKIHYEIARFLASDQGI